MVEADFSVALQPADRAREADTPHSLVVRFGMDKPLPLDAGIDLAPFQIGYQTYGTLNAERSNAVLICHALTGDQHVANLHPVTQKPGWWETMVGPGRPIDTERYFVICPNVLGACMGTTGPASTDPKTGMPWGLDFPVITVRDMVRAQAMLLDHLGIASLFSMAGGSMGGMQVLQWCASYPRRVFSALPIATSTRNGGTGAISPKAPIRGAGSPSRAWATTSRISPTRPCTASSVAGSRTATIPRFLSTPTSRWRAISATRAAASSSASMPIPISISPARWIISTSRRITTACSPTRSRTRRRGFA